MALRQWSRVYGTVDGSATRYSGGFEWQITNSDADRIANNRSILLVRMWAVCTQPQYGAYNATNKTSYININGTQYNQTTTFDFRNATANQIYYIGDGTTVFPKGAYKEVTIYHNADGTKTVNVATHFKAEASSSLQSINTSSQITLPTIPRQANLIGAANFNDENNPWISYNNSAGNSATQLVAAIYNPAGNIAYAGYRNISKTGNSYTFSLTEAERNNLRAAMPNNTSMTVRFYLRTLIGGQYFYSTLDRTVSITNANPTISATFKEVNQNILDVTGNNQLLIKGLSDCEVTAVPSAKKYATVSSVKIAGTTVSSPYKRTINDITATTVLLEVTDSRGLTGTHTLNLSYNPYEAITFMASFFRTAEMNSEVALQFSGTFYNTTIGATSNTLSARYRYQPELGEWSEWNTVPVVVDGNNFTNEEDIVTLGTMFDHRKQYMFEIEFFDALDIKTNTILVRAGRIVLKVTESVQVLQGKLHVQRLFTKNDKDFVFDFVYDIITRTWLVHVYGLTQMFEPQHVFQADVNARSIITVLNQEGYPLLKYTIDDTANNFVDHMNVDEPAPFNNYTMVDTGICPLPEILEKRARELQFTTFNTGAEVLEFFVTAYIDSRNVSNPDVTTIDWITDPEDPDYGKLYAVEEEIANVYGETNLDSWIIDMSRFPKTGLVKSHLRLHGKGLYFRTTIVNRDMIEHELSGITWVYRIMNAR